MASYATRRRAACALYLVLKLFGASLSSKITRLSCTSSNASHVGACERAQHAEACMSSTRYTAPSANTCSPSCGLRCLHSLSRKDAERCYGDQRWRRRRGGQSKQKVEEREMRRNNTSGPCARRSTWRLQAFLSFLPPSSSLVPRPKPLLELACFSRPSRQVSVESKGW